MSDVKNGVNDLLAKGCGCLMLLFTLWLILSGISLLVFYCANDSIDAVKKISLHDLSYIQLVQDSYSDLYQNRHATFSEILKIKGINVNKKFYDILKDNKFTKDITFSRIPLPINFDEVIVTAKMVLDQTDGGSKNINVRFHFWVKPKSLFKMDLSAVMIINEVDIDNDLKNNMPSTALEIIEFIIALQDEVKTRDYLLGTKFYRWNE